MREAGFAVDPDARHMSVIEGWHALVEHRRESAKTSHLVEVDR